MAVDTMMEMESAIPSITESVEPGDRILLNERKL